MKKLDIGRYSFESPNKAELHEDSLEIVKKVNEIIHWINEQSEPVELPTEECKCATNTFCSKHKKREMNWSLSWENVQKTFEPKETPLRDAESLLDKQLRKIEEAFEKQERELEKLKFQTLAEARVNGIKQGLDKCYPDLLYPILDT